MGDGWIPWALAGAGAVFLSLALPLRRAVRAWAARACRATGRVVDYEHDGDTDGAAYWPRVRFRAPDGAEVTFRGHSGLSRPPRIGAKVKVPYDPDAGTAPGCRWPARHV